MANRTGRCGVVDARVNCSANMILPRWRRRDADPDRRAHHLGHARRRHPPPRGGHIVIARNHARELEQALRQIHAPARLRGRGREGAGASRRDAGRHDEAQIRFDRIEAVNFESRMLRLLNYRLQRMEDGCLPIALNRVRPRRASSAGWWRRSCTGTRCVRRDCRCAWPPAPSARPRESPTGSA
jgi:predicted secreted Zn-dependent protease